MSTRMQVDTAALRAKAAQVKEPLPATPAPAGMPDGLTTTLNLVGILDGSAETMAGHVSAGNVEAQRLAACLNAAAQAYDAADAQSAEALNGQLTGGPAGSSAPSLTPVLPNTAGIPQRPTITPTSSPPPMDADGYLDWEQATETIYSGDTSASSVSDFGTNWRAYQRVLVANTQNFNPDIDGWHGSAASACGQRLIRHREWLDSMADQAGKLARQAETFVAAHSTLLHEHPTPSQVAEFNTTEWSDVEAKWARWRALQTQSELARGNYASTMLEPLNPPVPPSGCMGDASPSPTGTQPGKTDGKPGDKPGGDKKPGDGKPDPDAQKPEDQKPEDGKPDSDKPDSGDKPDAGDKPDMPEMPEMPTSTLPASTMPSMPSSGAGSTAGAGMPSSGMPMMPSMPRIPSMPSMPHNAGAPASPSMKPAHAGGGGGGPRGGAGGGGKTPKQPAMMPKSVGPGGHAPIGAAGGGAGPGPGVGGGGMGGGMPMGGHGGPGQGAKSKRQLGPEETIYTEDRAWTEGVIGNRKRKDTPDRKDSK